MAVSKRVLVVGASSGIGRAIALEASRRGMQVVAGARRLHLLEQLERDTRGAVTPVLCDVRDAEACEGAVEYAAHALGGLDVVVYATGITILSELGQATADDWQAAFETNVIGAVRIATSAVPRLAGSGGRLFVLSSDITEVPLYGLYVYGVSKAALDQAIAGLRHEHPDVPVIRVLVGPTTGTEVHIGWDPEVAQRIVRHWSDYANGTDLPGPEDVAKRILDGVEADEVADTLDVR